MSSSPPSPCFFRSIFSQIEEVGWENLLHSTEDLSSLSFRVVDRRGRPHILEVTLPCNYPECPPSVAADVPYIFELNWTRNRKLKDVVEQFSEHLKNLQEFWSTLDAIDNSLLIVEPKQPTYSSSYRQISLGNDCSLLVSIRANNPRSLPECRFFGPDSDVDEWRSTWRKNSKKWNSDKPFLENLTAILEKPLPRSPSISNTDSEQIECGICYSHSLPIDDELGSHSGSAPNYTCDSPNCRKAFHIVCLRDWLRSITTTRQSFDVLFGSCPYCSEPVAVKIYD